MRKNSFSGWALVLLLVLGAGCGSPIGRARPTAIPTRPPNLSWDGSIGALLIDRCASCHGNVAGISYSTYESAMRGSMHGPIILPGDPANSKVVIRQAAGNHPGQLSAAELARVTEWIKWGAPEK